MGNTVCKWEYLFVDVEGFLRKNCESAVQAEKMLRRINAGALLMNEKEEPFIAECIIRIMDIMRREEEFYIQEASGLLMALLAGIARLNRTPEQEMLYEEQSRSTVSYTHLKRTDPFQIHQNEHITCKYERHQQWTGDRCR